MFFKVVILFVLLAVVLSHEADKKKDTPQPYHFGYKTKSEHGTQFRNEKSDGKGRVHGSYGYTDATGNYREVTYVADHNGFRAEIRTNEHGTSDMDPANIEIESAARQEFGDLKKFVAKQQLSPLVSSEMTTTTRPKYAKYSDVRFFHFGQHSHEEKRGNDDEYESLAKDEPENSDEVETNDEVVTKADHEEGESDDGESEAEERTMLHQVREHGGHE